MNALRRPLVPAGPCVPICLACQTPDRLADQACIKERVWHCRVSCTLSPPVVADSDFAFSSG
jgi:hypothetical protein